MSKTHPKMPPLTAQQKEESAAAEVLEVACEAANLWEDAQRWKSYHDLTPARWNRVYDVLSKLAEASNELEDLTELYYEEDCDGDEDCGEDDRDDDRE